MRQIQSRQVKVSKGEFILALRVQGETKRGWLPGDFRGGEVAIHFGGQAPDVIAFLIREVKAAFRGLAGIAIGPDGIEVWLRVHRLADVSVV